MTTKKAKKPKLSHSEQQAVAQLANIREMVAAMKTDDDQARERAEQSIHEDPLSVEIRSAWHEPGQRSEQGEGEFCILLCTGGPACRIVGTLQGGEPDTVRLEHQDWGTPWTEWRLTRDEEGDLLTYCRCFYFGDGQ
jgi:hypothetical protein